MEWSTTAKTGDTLAQEFGTCDRLGYYIVVGCLATFLTTHTHLDSDFARADYHILEATRNSERPILQRTTNATRSTAKSTTMPPVRTARASKKAPPEGFEDIEDTLLEFQNQMKDAENASHEGKKKYEMTWPIFQITHQRSRYIYDLYYEKEAISKQLYDYLLKNGYADAMLIAKWKKQGYEKVCTLMYAQGRTKMLIPYSFAAPVASRPRRPISDRLVFAVCPGIR